MTPRSSGGIAAPAGLRRRLVSLLYESLILAAIVMAAALPLVMMTRGWALVPARAVLQAGLLAVCACFYVWQWSGTGQTLPMKTWRLRLVSAAGESVTPQRAFIRYLAVLASVATLGLGFLWAVVDRDRQFLHDRLAGTRIIAVTG